MQTATPHAAAAAPDDYVSRALARAVERPRRPAHDVDAALALFVRRARADDVPLDRMLDALDTLLRRHVSLDDRRDDTVALLMRRAITEYYR